jgi:hypothetical protein
LGREIRSGTIQFGTLKLAETGIAKVLIHANTAEAHTDWRQ